jgi:MFS transporter, CP family, cyanate transporter
MTEAGRGSIKPAYLLAGLVLAAATTRPQLVGVGPLIGTIQDDLDISHAAAGLLGTIPVLCMGVFAPVGPRVIRRFNVTQGVALCIALIAVGGLLRVATDSFPLILAATFVIGLGMGAMGSAMPVVVAETARAGRTLATALYITGIQLGAGISSALTVPLAHALGGWRASMAVVSAATAVALFGWLWLAHRAHPTATVPRRAPAAQRLSGDRRVWLLVLLFAAMAVCYYGAISWLADALTEDHGWSEASAGALVAMLNIMSLVGALAVPWLAPRVGSRRAQLLLVASAYALGFFMFAATPALAWPAGIIVGLANGALFTLVMVLPIEFAEETSEVGAIASAMLTAGYTLAALAPIALGALRDTTGSYSAVLWVIAGSGAVLVVATHAVFRYGSSHKRALAEPAAAQR